MCGLYGFTRTDASTRLMSIPLAIFMEARGSQSWGVTDGDYIYKEARSITDGFEELELSPAIYHTRAASCGAVTERNAHPFEKVSVEHNRRVIGIHNGCLRDHEELKKKYPGREGFEVDSEHIFQHLAEGRSLGDIHGYGAVCWFEMPLDAPAQRTIHWSRFGHGDNLHIAQLPDTGGLVFASTESAIVKAASMAGVRLGTFYKIQDNKKYCWMEATNELGFQEELDWCKDRPTLVSSSHTGGWDSGDGWTGYGYGGKRRGIRGAKRPNSGDSVCGYRHCNNHITENQVVCSACFIRIRTEHQGAATPPTASPTSTLHMIAGGAGCTLIN